MADVPTPEPTPEEVEVTDNSSGASTPAPDEVVEEPEAPEAPTVEDLVNDLERVTAQRDEYLSLAQSKQAEFENFRKRMSAQAAQAQDRGVAKAAKELLAPLDHLRLAVEHADESSRGPLESLQQEFLGALGRVGVESFSPVGEAFDPNAHDAVAHEEGDDGEPVVAETLRAGYRWNGHLLRPAMVRVRG